MIASTRCRSQFGKYLGVFSSLRAGRISVRPRSGPAKNASVSSPDRPLSVTTAVPGARAVRGLALQHLPGLLAFADELGVGQAEPGHGPVAGDDQQQLASPVPAGMAGAVAVACPSVQVRAPRGDDRVPARDGRGVHQPQHLRGAPACGPPATAAPPPSAAPRVFSRCVVLALAQQPGEQVPDPPRLRRAASAARRHNAAAPAPRPGRPARRRSPPAACPARTGRTQRGDDAVGQLDVECGQESVQVGDHDDFPRSDVCEHADLGHSSPASHGSRTACR